MAFTSMGSEIKLSSPSGPYCFWTHNQIYHSTSMLYPNTANKWEYGQLYSFDSAEATIKWFENHSNQRCMAEVMLCTVNPFPDS
jgi:hypothetical protein